MRGRITLICFLAGVLASSSTVARAEVNHQQEYLNIYLEINAAEQLEKQGDYRGALADFQDCYTRLDKIHRQDPDWETALVVQRLRDCKEKIAELTPKAVAQAPAPSPTPVPPNTPPGTAPETNPTPPGTVIAPNVLPTDLDGLKTRLMQVEQELADTKEKLRNSQIEAQSYKAQLDTVNQQLAALKAQQSPDDRLGKLLAENKELTDKLADAEKQISTFKSPNPKSTLSMLRVQLKNAQDKLAASEAANAGLQAATTTMQQQLNQAQADLAVANQKLAAAGPSSPSTTRSSARTKSWKGILTREIQEQSRRDGAKRLAQEEFDRLKLTSKVLQEQLDILGSPMTPATTDDERALLASLKAPGTDIVQPDGSTSGNTLTAIKTPSTNAPSSTPDTTTVVNPPSTNAPSMADTTTNQAPVTTPDTNSPPVTVTAPPSTPADTNSAPQNPAGTATTTPPATTNLADNPTPPATSDSTTNAPTTTQLPTATTTITDTTIQNNNTAPQQPDPEQYSTKPRVPEDMRDTAQAASDLFKMQRFDDAAAKYQEIIDKYPESLYAWSNLGVVRFQQGKLNEALRALQQAVKLSPSDAFPTRTSASSTTS